VTRSFSLYLDVLRIWAAVVVLVSHMGYTRFTNGRWLWVRELNLGSDAVVLFFVLSGLVIALTAETKDSNIRVFGFNRITRILSVALPALVIGFALDRLGAHSYPEFYALGWYERVPFAEQLFRGLSFSNEWGSGIRLGSNGPYWSLSYEVAYYAIFAIAFYLRGILRATLIALLTVVVGLNIMILAPCWIVGVVVWKCIRNAYIPALAVDLPTLLSYYTIVTLGIEGMRFSDEFIWNWLLAFAFGIHLMGAICLLKKEPSPKRARQIRWLAGGSFSLYLMHYPLLQFFGPALAPSGLPILDDVALFIITILLCLGFAQVFERTLPKQRRALQNTLMSLKITKGFPPINQ